MKISKTFVIHVLLFIAGSISSLSLTGCLKRDASNSQTGSFTLTDIPSQYNGKYAFFIGSNDADEAEAVTVFGATITIKGDLKFPQIKGRRVTLPLRYTDIYVGSENLVNYRRSEALKFDIYIYDRGILELLDDWICNVTFSSVVFSNGRSTQAWSAADDVYER